MRFLICTNCDLCDVVFSHQLGDLLNYGEDAYGEMYTQVLDETDYSYDTLRQAKYISKTFELSDRSENLPWSFYLKTAPLAIF